MNFGGYNKARTFSRTLEASVPYIDFAAIKERISIEQAAKLLNLVLKSEGQALRGRCPACQSSDNRSLILTPAKAAFYCHEAKTGGDCIALAAHINGTGMRQAAEFLQGPAPQARPERRKAAKPPQDAPGQLLLPLDYLDATNDAVGALGISQSAAETLGIGYANKGTMNGRVLIPLRLPDGTLVGYCGIALDHDVPFKFPSNLEARMGAKVIPLPRKRA
jgi:hypothetical protein